MYAAVLKWTLARGPPWARETAEQNDQLLAAVVVLSVVVLVLCVAVVYLWRQQVADDAQSPDTDAGTEPEQMSEFERLRQIEATVDGRLPQQAVVEHTDWSEAKVSRVVSRLAEEGRIEKVRVGRQNFIRLTDDDHEPVRAEPEEPA